MQPLDGAGYYYPALFFALPAQISTNPLGNCVFIDKYDALIDC